MCAIMIAKELGISNEIMCKAISEFTGVEHRIEYVRTFEGKDFYNDSKATNITATQIALSAFKKPTIILLGGQERTQNFLDLKDYMKNTKAVVCYGECKERCKKQIDSLGIKCTMVNTLKEAVEVANKESVSGDVILLSPASASWDQYAKFEDRGDEFKKLVKEL